MTGKWPSVEISLGPQAAALRKAPWPNQNVKLSSSQPEEDQWPPQELSSSYFPPPHEIGHFSALHTLFPPRCPTPSLPFFTFLCFTFHVLVDQSCLTLCDPMDCSPPSFSVRGILQARILEWVAIPISRASSWLRDQTWVSFIASRFFTDWINSHTLLSFCWPSSPVLFRLSYCSPGWAFCWFGTWGPVHSPPPSDQMFFQCWDCFRFISVPQHPA